MKDIRIDPNQNLSSCLINHLKQVFVEDVISIIRKEIVSLNEAYFKDAKDEPGHYFLFLLNMIRVYLKDKDISHLDKNPKGLAEEHLRYFIQQDNHFFERIIYRRRNKEDETYHTAYLLKDHYMQLDVFKYSWDKIYFTDTDTTYKLSDYVKPGCIHEYGYRLMNILDIVFNLIPETIKDKPIYPDVR